MTKRCYWGYPVKSQSKAERRLTRDLKYYGGDGAGNCAMLDQRNPQIVKRTYRDGSTWYQVEVDDVTLPLEYDLPGTTKNLAWLNQHADEDR